MKSNQGYIQATLLLLIALMAIPLSYLLYHGGPGGSGTLARMELPDGSEYKVTQHFNWSMEPYTVSFWMRSKGGKWGWCYIDHEATRWRDVAMTYDTSADLIMVTGSGTSRARLDRKRKAFWIENGSFSREVDAPQSEAGPGGSLCH